MTKFLKNFIFFLFLIISVVILPQNTNAFNSQNFNEVVNAKRDFGPDVAYAYAPSIIKDKDTYYNFFCSNPEKGSPVWDYIRLTKSKDRKNWDQPKIILKSEKSKYLFSRELNIELDQNYAACDPSVVFFQGFYYLYYSSSYQFAPGGCTLSCLTVIQVARSQNIEGPYQVYSRENTWTDNLKDAKNIIMTQKITSGRYGAGQQNVVAKDNKLYMWYTDDTVDNNNCIYFLESSDAVNWDYPNAKLTNLGKKHSIDVKYNAKRDRFVMIAIESEHSAKSSLIYSNSFDGLNWMESKTIIPEDDFPKFAHNPGISSDREGYMIENEPAIIAFGAAENLKSCQCWGKWNLYSTEINIPDILIQVPAVGAVERISPSYVVEGWAFDRDNPTTPSQIYIYLDNDNRTGFLLATLIANQPNAEANKLTGLKGNFGFRYVIPQEYRAGIHKLYFYTIDEENPDGKEIMLTGSPRLYAGFFLGRSYW